MNVSLNTGVTNALAALNRTSSMIEMTQNRLATGNKVNSAIDDPSAFFMAKGLSDRASDFTSLKDKIVQGIMTVKTAISGLDQISDLLGQMKGLAEQASAATTVADRTSYAAQYDALRTQIDSLAGDASYNGVNLIKGTPDTLKVVFNEDSSASLSIAGDASDAAGLSVTAANDWDNATLATGTTNIEADIALVDAAIASVRTTIATFGSNVSVLQSRSDFTSELIKNHNDGAAQLTLADLNEESAKLLALQTRQQLSIQSLSMAGQSEQSILALFR